MKRRFLDFLVVLPISVLVALAPCPGGASSLSQIKEFAQAEVVIEHLRHQDNMDWPAMREQFHKALPVVRHSDAAYGTDYEQEISQALKHCQDGQQPGAYVQIVAKGLQHVAVLHIEDMLAHMSSDKRSPERIAVLYQGIRSTFRRRDTNFFPKTKLLTSTADQAVESIGQSGQDAALTSRQELMDVIKQTYALSMLYEIQEVERIPLSSQDKLAEKRVEAQMFFRIVGPHIKRNNPRAYATLKTMLHGRYVDMDAHLLEETLKQGLPGIRLR